MLCGLAGLLAVLFAAAVVAGPANPRANNSGPGGPVRIGDNGLLVPFSTGDDAQLLSRLPSGFEWLTVRGTWGILDGTAYVSRTAEEPGETLAMMGAPTNLRLSAVLSTVADGAGLVFGYQDEQNYWAAVVRTRDGVVELRLVGGEGNPIVATSNQGLSLPDGVRLRVQHDEAGISVALDGKVVIELPAVPPVANAHAGMLSSGAEAHKVRFDDLTIMDAEHVPKSATTQSAP